MWYREIIAFTQLRNIFSNLEKDDIYSANNKHEQDDYVILKKNNIEENAFRNCASLTDVTIPASLRKTGKLAFYESYQGVEDYIDLFFIDNCTVHIS